jgi:hypothetical protein
VSNDDLTDLTETLQDYIYREVASGFRNADAITESARLMCQEEGHPQLAESLVPGLVQEAVTDQRCVQQTWPAVTDCDRLDAAFAELTKNGIVARQDFSCCGTCGVGEIGAEIEQERRAGIAVRGYTFYHLQDTESAVEGYGLCLNYGDLDGNEDASVAIAKEIVQTLERHGLSTTWNGSYSQRIGVKLNWQRRWPE